jgi:electron transfer flavoprotein alpha subunit
MTTAIVFVEHAEGTPRRASLECVGAAAAAGATVIAVLTGAGAAAAAPGVTGAAEAVVLTGGDGYSPDAVAAGVADLAKARRARGVFAAATYRGKDLLPRVAALLDVAPFADCIGLAAAGDGFEVRRPWLAGKCVATLQSKGSALVATTRLNVFKAAASGAPASTSEVALTVAPKARVTAIEAKGNTRLDVKEAPVVVAGGRGLQGRRALQADRGPRRRLRPAAAVGASRAVVDAGWRPHGEQVGQTGKVVSPAALHRRRHLGRDPAPRRHAHRAHDRRDQQGRRRADLQGRRLRHRRRRLRGPAGDRLDQRDGLDGGGARSWVASCTGRTSRNWSPPDKRRHTTPPAWVGALGSSGGCTPRFG